VGQRCHDLVSLERRDVLHHQRSAPDEVHHPLKAWQPREVEAPAIGAQLAHATGGEFKQAVAAEFARRHHDAAGQPASVPRPVPGLQAPAPDVKMLEWSASRLGDRPRRRPDARASRDETNDQSLAIGGEQREKRPVREVGQARTTAAIEPDRPDIVLPTGIGKKRDRLVVRGEARKPVARIIVGEARQAAAVGMHDENVLLPVR
jgi:hypothetical protein